VLVAEAPAYTTVPGKISVVLAKIRETGVPPKVTNAWLEALGLKSTNDRTLLPVLKQIGLIDASSVPTPAWRQYRGADHMAVLGRAIQLGYADLYQTYPNAHDRTNADVGNVFTTLSNAGKQSIDKMVSTFKNLAALAEFSDGAAMDATAPPGEVSALAIAGATAPSVVTMQSATQNGLSVNINIALTLPETSDEKVFAAFFKAMRVHLLADTSK
jgi:hypothetical protein